METEADETLLHDPGEGSNSSSEDEALSDPADGLSADECIQRATEAKSEGNQRFSARDNAEACQKYQLGVQYLSKHSAHPAARELLLSMQSNLAAAQIRLELWDDAVISTTAALQIDSTSAKALYRRGLARSRLGEWEGAKLDLIAVCRVDPKNREARNELAAVQAQLAQLREQEKEKLSKLFAGKSLYAAEERERKRQEEEMARKEELRKAEEAQAEEAMRVEWRAECARLRAEAAAQQDAQREATAAAAEARAGMGAAAGDGDAKKEAGAGCDAPADDDENPPITFEAFKKQIEDKKRTEKEALDKAEEEAKAAARHERMLRAKAKEVLSDDEDLSGLVRGYKKRADGSTTSYFDREVDEKTKAMLDQMKAPKRISAGQSEETTGATSNGAIGGGAGVGSAWNRAGTTWEDKDMTKWATERLRGMLGAVVAAVPMDADCAAEMLTSSMLQNEPHLALPLRAKITSVKSCDGSATITSSRGVLRHALDYCFDLEFEITPDDGDVAEATAILKDKKYAGTLKYTDVTSPTQADLQVTYKKGKAPTTLATPRITTALDALKAQVGATLGAFVAEFKLKGI